ncbi:uncharacterized protein LOC110057984 [Orbicella faveolata]|uniref:uncharacterized protein LOC110057984 n=1 Tax=Orbicella faveolata TaxID=48498 RepID=UPI0009E38B67|nr:uncharacterized protein LOC110057984 [Orbicella faveolata]
MTGIRLCSFKPLVACFGIAILVVIARRNILWKNSPSTKEWSTFYQEIALQLTHSQIHTSSCNPERVPESLKRLYRMYDDVKTFVMFIGYPHTIESLTGAILDAHPEILIPQEYDVIGNWKMFQHKSLQDSGQQKHMLFFDMHYLSTFQAVFRNKANKPSQFWLWTSKGNGIHYNFVPDAWQGTISGKLKVFGDGSGWETSKKLMEKPGTFKVLEDIQNVVGVPVKFIHVISNPYDVIASSVISHPFDPQKKINDTGAVRNAVQNFFTVAETNERIRKLYGNAVLDISSDQLIFNSRETLRKICIFLDVTCYDSYLNKVERLLNGHSTRSRNLVAWRKEDRDLITTEGAKYSFLQSFTFDDVSSFTH